MTILYLVISMALSVLLPLQVTAAPKQKRLALPNINVSLPGADFEPLSADNLSLFTLLNQTVVRLEAAGDNLLQAQKDGLILIKQEIDLLKQLVGKLNTLEFEKKSEIHMLFTALCNSIDPGNFKPRHARDLMGRLERLNVMLFKYFLKSKNEMTVDERALFDQLILFDHYLKKCLLNEDLFNYSFGDLCLDTVWYEPAEWVAANPWLTAGIVVAAAAAIYWIAQPKTYGVVFDQGWSNHCGAYAALNALLVATPGAKVTGNVDMAAAFTDIRRNIEQAAPPADAAADVQAAHAARLARFPEDPVGLHDDNIRDVLAEPLFIKWAGSVMGVQPNVPASIEVLGDYRIWREGVDNAIRAVELPRVRNVVDRLRPGQSCVFICNDAPLDAYDFEAGKNLGKNIVLHWVVVQMRRDSDNNITTEVYDSTHAGQVLAPVGNVKPPIDFIERAVLQGYRWI